MKAYGLWAALFILAVGPAYRASAQETRVRWFGHAAFFRDMVTMGEEYQVDLALLNIGGHFGVEPGMAARAAQAVGAKLAVPQHYATFTGITETPAGFAAELKRLNIPFYEMRPGETITFRGRQLVQKPGAQQTPAAPAPVGPTAGRDGQHDFDFEIGTWKTHLRRLLNPLTGSNTWVEYEGTTVVRKVWGGRANLVELVADGPAGHFEGLSLRLYNPQSRQWSLNFANSRSGTLSQPTVGGFKDGRGEFFDQETFNGRAVLVRFVISDITADSCRFEQSFSDDGGKTWELNWVATDTRVKD